MKILYRYKIKSFINLDLMNVVVIFDGKLKKEIKLHLNALLQNKSVMQNLYPNDIVKIGYLAGMQSVALEKKS